MKSKWETVTLGKTCDMIPGFAFKSEDFGDYSDKVIKIGDIIPPYVDMQTVGGVNIKKYNKDKLKKLSVCEGDFVFAMSGATIGKVGQVINGKGYINQRILKFVADEKLIDKKFLYYTMLKNDFLPFVNNYIDSQTAQPNISNTTLGKYTFLLPSLPEQRIIATILSCLDDKIANNVAINHHLEQMAQAIFKSWFVDFEPFADGGFIESKLGEIPIGWRVGLLSELVTVRYGKDHKKLTNGTIPVFGSGGLMRFVNTALYYRESVLIPRKGTLNNIIYVNHPFWSVDTMFYTEMNRPNLAKFVYFFVRSKDLASMNAGSAVPSMTTEILNNLPIVIPPDSELARYEEVVSAQFKQMQTNQAESDNLADLRDSLLPRLMSGELSVSDIDPDK